MDAIELLQLFERLLAETPLGKVLIMMDAEACRDSQVNSYLHDFVHFVYIAKSEDEHKVYASLLYAQGYSRNCRF